MQNEIRESPPFGRRDFIKTAGGAAILAAMPNGLTAAASGAPAKPLTLAFVGCAHIHTPGFIKLLASNRPNVLVKFAWDHDAARVEKRAAELGAAVATDLQQIWSDPEVVAVVICSETNRHRDLVLAAAAAGKHVYAEKPLGITAKESAEMADAISNAKVLLTTGYFMRTIPQHLFLKRQVELGAFGRITRIAGSNCHNGSLGAGLTRNRASPGRIGAGWRIRRLPV
jgi:predicted dehydrogenase